MGETCDHVAEMFLVEPAVCTGLTNPSCSSFANEWLPCRKYIELTKIKDLNFDRENLAQCGKKKRLLVANPKKKFKLLAKWDRKPLSLIYFVSAFEKIVLNRILFTAIPKPKIDFVQEIITDQPRETDIEVTRIESLKLSKTKVSEKFRYTFNRKNQTN